MFLHTSTFSIPSLRFISLVVAIIYNIVIVIFAQIGISILYLENGIYISVPIFKTFNMNIVNAVAITSNPSIL